MDVVIGELSGEMCVILIYIRKWWKFWKEPFYIEREVDYMLVPQTIGMTKTCGIMVDGVYVHPRDIRKVIRYK